MRAWTRWQSWLNVVLGVWLFISPWVLGSTSDAAAAWDAWIVGAAIVVVALIALATPRTPGISWLNVILGAWLFISPWVLRYTGTRDAAWNAWVFGVIAVILALWAVLPARRAAGGLGTADRLQTR